MGTPGPELSSGYAPFGMRFGPGEGPTPLASSAPQGAHVAQPSNYYSFAGSSSSTLGPKNGAEPSDHPGSTHPSFLSSSASTLSSTATAAARAGPAAGGSAAPSSASLVGSAYQPFAPSTLMHAAAATASAAALSRDASSRELDLSPAEEDPVDSSPDTHALLELYLSGDPTGMPQLS